MFGSKIIDKDTLKLAGVPKVSLLTKITRKTKKKLDDFVWTVSIGYLIILCKLGLARK